MSKRTCGIMTRLYEEPGRGQRVQFYLYVKGSDNKDSRAIAAAAIGKTRGAEIIDSLDDPAAIEIHGLSAASIADGVLKNATLAIAGLLKQETAQQDQNQAV